jgi:hypothetical protein
MGLVNHKEIGSETSPLSALDQLQDFTFTTSYDHPEKNRNMAGPESS